MKHLPKPLTWVVVLTLKVWAATLRLRVTDPHGQMTDDAQLCIFALWHNRLLLLPATVDPKRRRRIAFLASRSRDGGYISDILHGFGMQSVRGSSSKGGAAALRNLQQNLGAGVSVAMTPDGPRGPRYEVQDGIVWLAARMGLPIVPVVLNTASHRELKNWDKTQIPLPFSKAELRFGEPLTVPGDLDKADLAEQKARIRAAMLEICWGDHEAELSAAEPGPTS